MTRVNINHCQYQKRLNLKKERKKLDNGVSVRSVCEFDGIGSSTVSDINKQKEKLLVFFLNSESKKHMFKRISMKPGKSAQLD